MRSSRLAVWIGLVLCAHATSAQPPSPSDTAVVEWPVYGGSLASQFYSPLDQINARNVKDLKVAWRWSAGNFGPNPLAPRDDAKADDAKAAVLSQQEIEEEPALVSPLRDRIAVGIEAVL